jgi:hypothetical protein
VALRSGARHIHVSAIEQLDVRKADGWTSNLVGRQRHHHCNRTFSNVGTSLLSIGIIAPALTLLLLTGATNLETNLCGHNHHCSKRCSVAKIASLDRVNDSFNHTTRSVVSPRKDARLAPFSFLRRMPPPGSDSVLALLPTEPQQ